VPERANPVTGPVAVAVQEKSVPATVEVRFTGVLVSPEQMVCSRGQFVTVGLGFTVTVCVAEFPEHPAAEDVMVY